MKAYEKSPKKQLYILFQTAYQLAGLTKEYKMIKKHWKTLLKYKDMKPLKIADIIIRDKLYGGTLDKKTLYALHKRPDWVNLKELE